MPKKSYIEFRLNPDKLKEELRGIVPGYRALEYFHDNPDSSFTNTLDLLAEDVVPFYAAHKYGAGPGDFIKEAFLLGMTPAKAKKVKNYVKKHPNGHYENVSNELYDLGDLNSTSEAVRKPGQRGNFAYEEFQRVDSGEPYFEYNNINDVLTDIDESVKVNGNSPYAYDNPNISKAISLNENLNTLNNLKKEIETAKKNNQSYVDIWNAGEFQGTVDKADYDKVLNNVSQAIKQANIDIKAHNASMDFLPEYEEFGAPYVDVNNRNYLEDILRDKESQYLKGVTKKLKFPYQE